MTTPDDDAKALGEAGYEVLDTIELTHYVNCASWGKQRVVQVLPGDLIVRRLPPAPEQSECERMFITDLAGHAKLAGLSPAYVSDSLAAFRKALAREIAAAEQRGYDRGYAEAQDMAGKIAANLERQP